MNETLAWDGEDPDRLRRVDDVCDAFEDECRAGRRPAAEDYLTRVPEGDRPQLLQELRRIARDSCPAGPTPTVPGYEILGELGRGGMGVVYQARHLKLNRLVALKMVLGGAHAGPDRLTRFRNEAEANARLQHPHVVQIHDYGDADGLPYLALEFVGGGTLAGHLARGGRPSPDAAAELVRKLAAAVAAAHAHGIVHRDLKPPNVLLTEDAEPKIADFGLAKVADAGPGPTVSGSVFGTPAYMAPEQARGDARAIGPAADLYALGVILFELLTGRVPFRADSTIALLRKIEHEPPPAPRSLNRGVPRDLEAICLKCLEKAPADRYPSAAALAGDLERHLARKPPLHARPPGPVGRFWRRCRRNPIPAGLSALLAVAATGLVVHTGRDDSLERVRRSGKLVVGVDPNGAPYSSWKDGKLAGIDVDVAHAVAGRLGVAAEPVELYWDWSAWVRQLDDRKLDVLISCVSITEERGQQVSFVEYARDPFVLVARPDLPIRSRGDLDGKELVVQQDTAAERAAERLKGEGVGLRINAQKTVPDTFRAVLAGERRVLLEHGRIARRHLRDLGPALQAYPLDGIDPALADQRLGITLRRDARALRAAVGEAVRGMEADGTLVEILRRWE